MRALDLFRGGGGWSVACKRLSIDDYGVETMDEANATAIVAGHHLAFTDVWKPNKALLAGLKFDGLIASPPCFPAGTPVLTKRGSVNIEDVVVGDDVWTHANRWRPVTATMNREAQTVRLGHIVSTPDHPFYARPQVRRWDNSLRRDTWSLGEPGWVHAEKLQGNFTATPMNVTGVPGTWPCDPWLAGRYVADGWTGRDGVMLAVGDGREIPEGEWTISQTGPSCRRFTRADHVLAATLHNDFGQGAANKTFPTWILNAPRHEREAFLAGYLSGDGHKDRNVWSATTVSARLASMLHLLGVGLGMTVSIIRVESEPTTVIEGRTVNQRPYYRVNLAENDGRFTRDIDGHRWAKQRKAPVPGDVTTVYDLTVADDHSFVAWAKVVHNCQTFSMAGKGKGREALDVVLGLVPQVKTFKQIDKLRKVGTEAMGDERTALVLSPLWYALNYDFDWLAFEQVPAVQPVWDACAAELEQAGWNVWTGKLHSEQYGVPQTRTRSILIGARTHAVGMPEPTHSRYYPNDPGKLDMGVEPWVSMAEGLGRGLLQRPSFTYCGVSGNAVGDSEWGGAL